MVRPKFRVGYAGETEYEFKGRLYRVRHHSMNSGFWNAGYFPEQCAKTGTLTNGNSERFHEFPPEDVCEFFPGYVPARWLADWTIEYKGGKAPETMPDDTSKPDGIVAKVYRDEMAAWDAFHDELHAMIPLFGSWWEYSSFRDSMDRDRHVPSDADYQRVRDKLAELSAQLQTV